jgi:hypothetical protein
MPLRNPRYHFVSHWVPCRIPHCQSKVVLVEVGMLEVGRQWQPQQLFSERYWAQRAL